MSLEIVNVVGSGDLHTELDLSAVGADLSTPYVEYDPSNYHGLYVRIKEDGPLITMYRSGKYIVTGSQSFDELEKTKKDLLLRLNELGIIREGLDTGFSIQNIVCTDKIGKTIQLDSLAICLGLELIEYEPEQFPGLIYRPSNISAVILVFASGRVVITGCEDLETVETAINQLRSKIEKQL